MWKLNKIYEAISEIGLKGLTLPLFFQVLIGDMIRKNIELNGRIFLSHLTLLCVNYTSNMKEIRDTFGFQRFN